jgi:hypothetical protein
MCIVDTVPPAVIVLNAITIGLSADVDPENTVWKILELVWISVYLLEFVFKILLHGLREYFRGADRSWNLFDFTCLGLSLFDVFVTYIFATVISGSTLVGLMKMVRLIRLMRLVRALHFPVFDELKQMVIGVAAGMRVLLWAVVLLFVIVFSVAVAANSLMGAEEKELATLPMSMLTVFRCYTDGCVSFDGASLSSRLFHKYGAPFFFGYMLSFMFVTFGMFNLIMAFFIENVVSRGLKRKLHDIGVTMPEIRLLIRETLLMLIARDIAEDEDADRAARYNGGSVLSARTSTSISGHVDTFLSHLEENDYDISRAAFTKWLERPEMCTMLARADIDLANQADLFDVLDVDMSETLGLDEVIQGLMLMRGPITKSDVVAIRLQMRHLVEDVHSLAQSMEKVVKSDGVLVDQPFPKSGKNASSTEEDV